MFSPEKMMLFPLGGNLSCRLTHLNLNFGSCAVLSGAMLSFLFVLVGVVVHMLAMGCVQVRPMVLVQG